MPESSDNSAKRSASEKAVFAAADASKETSEHMAEVTKALRETNKQLVKHTKGRERVSILAGIHFKAIDTSIKGMVEDYKSHSKKMGVRADSNAIAMAADMKQVLKSAQEGSRLAVSEAKGQLEGFAKAIEFAGEREREFLKKAVAQTQKAVGEIEAEMPSVMGEIVNETIQIPLDALDGFMESNYFTRILKNAFLAAKARKKAALKEEKMRLEQIESERIAQEHLDAQVLDFFTSLKTRLSEELGDSDIVDEKAKEATIQHFQANPNTDETAVRATLGMGPAPTADEKMAEQLLQEISDELKRQSEQGLGISSPGWLSQIPELIEQGKEQIGVAQEQVVTFKDGVKEQVVSFKESIKGKFDDFRGRVAGAVQGFRGKPTADVGAGEPEGVAEPQPETTSGLTKFLESIKGGLAGIGEGVADALKGIFNAVAEGFKKLGDPEVLRGVASVALISVALLAFAGAMFVFGMVNWPGAMIGLLVFSAFVAVFAYAAPLLAGIAPMLLIVANALTALMVPLVLFGVAMVLIATAFNIFTDSLMQVASLPFASLFKLYLVAAMFASVAPLLAVAGVLLTIASPGFMVFGLALAALGFGIKQFNSVGLRTILATMTSLYVLAALAIPLAIASPFLLVASIGFGAFGVALMLLGIGISQFIGVIPAILPMVAGLYALTVLALPLALASPFLLVASVGFGAFGVALMLLGIGISQFIGVIPAILPMVASLYLLTALAIPLALASPLLVIASIGFGAFGVALAVLAFGISQFMGIFFAIPVMIAGLYSLVALAVPLAIVSPLLLIASVAIGAFGVGLALLALGVSQFMSVLPAILPMVVSLYAVAALAIPLGLMSPFLLLAAVGIAAFGLALIPLGIAMSMFSVEGAAGFAAAMGALVAFAVPLALLSLFGVFQLAASGLVAIAIGVLALAVATVFLAQNYDILASVLKHLIVLGLVGPLLVVAAVGIFLVAGALLAFSVAMVAVNAVMAAGAVVGLLGSLFGAENPLDMLFAIAAHADQLYLAGKGILFMAMGIGMLAKSLKNLDPEALAEIGESMQGILPGKVGGDMNFVAGNLIQGVPAQQMAGQNEENASLGRAMVAMPTQSFTNIIAGGGGGAPKQEGGRQVSGTDGQIAGNRMNESTFRRVQERFYKSSIV